MAVTGRLLRPLFVRSLRAHWSGHRVTIYFWDRREVSVGRGPEIARVTIREPSVLAGMLRHPSLGFGDAYVDGRLTVEGDLQAFLRGLMAMRRPFPSLPLPALRHVLSTARPAATPAEAEADARFHYDTGNAFFSLWLDPSLTYSCAYFRRETDDLATAQEQKRELICRKLDLQPDQALLDVGCGWGSFLFHAIERYGVRGTGITPSREQAALIGEEARRRGLADRLTLHVADWRAVGGTFDRIVSVGMYEHVGRAAGAAFFRQWAAWLKPGGVSVLHTIGGMEGAPADPWLARHIFPGTYLPSLAELAGHAARTGLVVADVENLWRHYTLTLAAWRRNFDAKRSEIERLNDARFARTWWLYLNAAEATFAAGRTLLWQIVLTKGKRRASPLTRDVWSLAAG